MLKARVGDMMLFGLSADNVARLMDGKPILIDLTQLGYEKGNVVIFYGRTETDMEFEVRKHFDTAFNKQ